MAEPKTVAVTPEVHEYLVAHSTPPDAVQRSLIEATAALGAVSGMQIAPEQGAFMTLLPAGRRSLRGRGGHVHRLLGAVHRPRPAARRPAAVPRRQRGVDQRRPAPLGEAGVDDRIELRIGPAADTLRALPADPPIDLAFIDADKAGYRTYYDEIVERLRPGGVVLLDNVLWGGTVVDAADTEDDTVAIRAVNDHVAADPRVEVVMLPIADGLTIARRRP